MALTSQTAGILAFQRVGLDKIVNLYAKNLEKQYTQFTSSIPGNKQAYYRFGSFSDLPAASDVNQATGMSPNAPYQPYFADVYYVKRGIGVSFASEVLEYDVYGVFKQHARWLAMSMLYAIEGDMANFLNLGFTTQTTPDGVAIFSASHPYQGGNDSTILSTAPNLGIYPLEQALAAVRRQHTYVGEPWQYNGSFTLVVPPELEWLAHRLIESDKFPTTNDNDPNVAKRRINKVATCQRITSTTAWFLVPSTDDENPLKYSTNRELKVAGFNPANKDTQEWYATQIWMKKAQDYRGLMASAGS
jgi:hypothetical protein